MGVKAQTVAILSNCPVSVESNVIDYLADTAAAVFDDEDMSPAAAGQELENFIVPLLEESE